MEDREGFLWSFTYLFPFEIDVYCVAEASLCFPRAGIKGMCHHILGKMTTFDIEVSSKEKQGTELPKFHLFALKKFFLYHHSPKAGTDILDQSELRGTFAHKG